MPNAPAADELRLHMRDSKSQVRTLEKQISTKRQEKYKLEPSKTEMCFFAKEYVFHDQRS